MDYKLSREWDSYAEYPCDDTEKDFLKFYASQLAQAISQDDAVTLKNLLDTYGGISLVDYSESSLLNYAVYCGSHKAFKILIETPGVHIDAQDENNRTALHHSIIYSKADLALELVNKGADIYLVDYYGQPAFHMAIEKKLLQVSVLLIEGGVDIDCCDREGKTPLTIACEYNWVEGVCMLLFYGARADTRIIPQCLDRDADIREIVSNFLFDEHKYFVSLDILIRACQNYSYWERSQEKSFFFNRFLDSISEITNMNLEKNQLSPAFQGILEIDSKHFQKIVTNFENVLKYIISELSNFCHVVRITNEKDVENWTVFMNSKLSSLDLRRCFQLQFEYSNMYTDDVRQKFTDLISFFLSKGARFSKHHVSVYYDILGYSSLFKRMLRADILTPYRHYGKKDLMAVLICDINMSWKNVLDDPYSYRDYDVFTFDEVLGQFCNQKFNQFCSTLSYDSVQRKVKEMPQIPLLTELARNEARQHIIDFFQVGNFRDFDDIVEQLDIAVRYKQMLTYELKLY